MQVWKTTGRKPRQLEETPEPPDELAYVWEWYREVFSGEVLTFTELTNWSNVTKKNLKPWEAELIRSLDRIYWSVQNERHR